MSDEFQSGVCSGNWWNSSPRNGLHASGSVPCSTSISEIGSFAGWSSEVVDMRVRSCEESVSVSDSSMVFQDSQKPQGSDSVSGGGGGSGGSNNNTILMDSTLQMMGYGLSNPTMDWNQGLLNRNTDYLQENMMESSQAPKNWSSPRTFSGNSGDSSVAFNKLNQSLSLDHNRLNLGNSSDTCTVTCQGLPVSYSMDSPVQYGYQAPYLQGLFDPDLQQQPPGYQSQPIYAMNSNELPHSWQKLPQQIKQQANTNQLHFSNNTPFWNPSASGALMTSTRPSVLPPVQNQIFVQTFEEKSNCSNYTPKPKPTEVRDSGLALKKPSNEPPLKRPRVETPSPLPIFKVRKEKLGDRVTALQQLVSPFGKTDTASVLFEAIEYIKFLHEQVSVLSAAYMKNGAPIQHQQATDKSKDAEGPQQDLRSRGLCLVPMQSIFSVTNETNSDFWTPTFGGTYR